MISGGLAATAALPIEVSDEMIAGLRRTSYRTLRAILAANGTYIAQRTVPDRLAALGKPVLVIFGDSDPRWNPGSARMYDAVPQCTVEYLPGVGHLAMLEDPARLASLLLSSTN
jgi:pimeloyl-ACP methyl ester carboxylesterase